MPGTEPTRVAIVDCAKTFADGTRALARTSLVVQPGEVLALLGPSGCGKTTLLRLVAGLEHPDAGGRILFDEDDAGSRPVETRGVGMVFQHYALFPQMTVAANIGYGLTIRKVPDGERRQRVGELIDLVRLNGLEQRRPAELSGGQRQRVALARAVAIRPRVLLLDEPLTALDAKLKESLRDELAGLLRALRITTLHVTHDQQEALAIADRLAVMRAGSVIQVGQGEELYRQPGHPFVAEFLGRVNRLTRSGEDLAARCVSAGTLRWPCPDALAMHRVLLVRPEDVQVASLATSMAVHGAATVTRRMFLGERVQLQVKADDATLTAEVPRDSALRPGDRVTITIAPHAWLPGVEDPPS